MTKIRAVYGLSMLAVAGVFLWNGAYLTLYVFLFQLLLFLGLKFFLHMEINQLQLKLNAPASCMCGQKLRLHLTGSDFFAISAAVMEGDLICEDRLLGEVTKVPFSVNLKVQSLSLSLDFHPVLCGSYTIRLENVRCLDIFGLNSVSMPAPEPCQITVYPKPISVHFVSSSSPHGQAEEGQYAINRRGNDASEVFDLREYQPGDDIHAIHWKLSQKMEELLIRESADSPRYDTLLLLDIGRNEHGQPCDTTQLSLAVSLALSVSKELLNHQLPHHVGAVSGNQLFISEIREYADCERLTDLWMDLKLPDEKGTGLRLLPVSDRECHYRRLFYLTTGICPDAIDSLRSDLTVMALCIQENAAEAGMSRHGSQIFLNLTEDQLNKGRLNITL